MLSILVGFSSTGLDIFLNFLRNKWLSKHSSRLID